VVVLSCFLRKSVCYFVAINSNVSFHPFKLYFTVPFVQVYCSLPDLFYQVAVIFGVSY
jgi:hypothetical protein